MRYLAIDSGRRRTGLAVGDDELRIATPLRVVETRSDEARRAAIERAIAAEGPDALVLGLPLNMDDSEGGSAKSARQLAVALHKASGLPVLLVDERLTSDEADGRLARSGLTHDQKKQRRDAIAAALILQTFWSTGAIDTIAAEG